LARSLAKEAADEGTTVNADINSIISEHFNWHKKAREFGIVVAPKSVFTSMIEGLDDKTLARIGREVVPTAWKEMAEFWFQDSSPDGVLDLLNVRAKFNPSDQTKTTREEGAYTIVFRHDFGPRWSILAKSALQEFVKRSFHVEPQMSQGESVVTARFKINPRNLHI
jgi:hypothetical protein